MKIAIPTENGRLCPHFGHCQTFTIVNITPDTRETLNIETLTPPPHEEGVIPAWLNRLGCTHIIAGGIGHRAVALFEQNGVQVVSGVPSMKPEDAVSAWLNGELETDSNPCHDPDFHLYSHGEGQCRSDRHQDD